jgi:hypothetical protein
VSNKTLSKRLKFWRAERPDEWIMDEFIRDAEVLERQLNDLAAKLVEVSDFCRCAASKKNAMTDLLFWYLERLIKEVTENEQL